MFTLPALLIYAIIMLRCFASDALRHAASRLRYRFLFFLRYALHAATATLITTSCLPRMPQARRHVAAATPVTPISCRR